MKHLICAAALALSGAAQADVLNFEGTADSPFVYSGDHLTIGKYWVEAYDGLNSGPNWVGSLVDGSDNAMCAGMSCPVNNPSQYYAALADSYFYFGMNDDSNFRLMSMKVSFIGNGQSSFPTTSGLLVIQGYDINGKAVGGGYQVGIGGPNSGGVFNFANINLNLGNIYSYVRILGYACDATGSCNRGSNNANFAFDDIVTQAVPEPGSMALFGLGLMGLGAVVRRRRAA